MIFDLDETLVHCINEIDCGQGFDVPIEVNFASGISIKTGINIRPFAFECIQKASQMFQVVVFTASHKSYADVVIDYLDPEKKIIDYRLYRKQCLKT